MSLFNILRQRFLRGIALVVVSFQIINMSIDPVDHHVGIQDISVNEIESCVEFVLEIVMEKGDAIEETDEHDGSSNRHTAYLVLFSVAPAAVDFKTPFRLGKDLQQLYFSKAFFSPVLKVTSPPPKHA